LIVDDVACHQNGSNNDNFSPAVLKKSLDAREHVSPIDHQGKESCLREITSVIFLLSALIAQFDTGFLNGFQLPF